MDFPFPWFSNLQESCYERLLEESVLILVLCEVFMSKDSRVCQIDFFNTVCGVISIAFSPLGLPLSHTLTAFLARNFFLLSDP